MSKPEKPEDGAKGDSHLRAAAEAQLAGSTGAAPEMQAKTLEEIIHELQVRHVELEMQNEELKRAHLALDESRTRYLDLYDFAPVGYFTFTPVGRIVEANLTGAALLGIERGNLIDRGFGSFVVPEDLEQWERHLASVRQLEAPFRWYGEKRSCELTLKREDGSTFHARLESVRESPPAARLPGSQEQAAGSGGTQQVRTSLIDITKRKKAEEENAHLQAEVAQIHKMEAIGRLTGGVAHDFNNLLLVIKGNAEQAWKLVDETEPVYDHLNEIRAASLRAASLTRQLLLFSRREPMHFGTLDMNKLIQNTLAMLGRLIGENILIRTDLEPGLGTIRGNEGNLEQVVMNLVINAKDAMPKGGLITIRTRNVNKEIHSPLFPREMKTGKYICLSVLDSGVGMDSEQLSKIFEPYFSTKEDGKGSGLGLSVVHGIVSQHGGYIDVHSVQGEGSTFDLYFPILEGAAEEESRRAPVAARQGHGERVLLVEDDGAVRKHVTKLLAGNGYVVEDAADVRGAMKIIEIERGAFDVACIDVALPDGSGIQLAEGLVGLHPDLGIVLTSGCIDRKSEMDSTGRRGFIFLQKPYEESDLLRAVGEALQSRKSTAF